MPKTDFYNCTLSTFITCCVDKVYKLGYKTKEENELAWVNIYNSFKESLEDENAVYLFTLERDCFVLREKIKIVNTCISLLWETYNRGIAIELNHVLSINLQLDWSNKVEYYKQLNLALSHSKRLKINADKLDKEYTDFISSNKGEGYSRKYFSRLSANLSKYMNFYVQKDILLCDYTEMINSYTSHIEAINSRSQALQDS